MTIITTEVEINETTYGFRFPVGRIIMLEREIGKPISQLSKDMSGLVTLIKYSIQKDGKYLTASEFEDFLDNIDADDLAKCAEAVSKIMSNGKN